MAAGHGRAARGVLRHHEEHPPLRTDLALPGRHGQSPGSKLVQGRVKPGAAPGVGHCQVPDQEPAEVLEQIKAFLTKDPPWDVKVSVKAKERAVKWWMTDPNGPAFDAAMKALKKGYNNKPVAIGCGGTIGFVGPLAELFG